MNRPFRDRAELEVSARLNEATLTAAEGHGATFAVDWSDVSKPIPHSSELQWGALKGFSTPLDAEETLLICEPDTTVAVMLKPDGYTIRFPCQDGPPGEHGSIAFKDKHWKIFQEVQLKARAQLEAAMKAWCRFGPTHLPPQKFKFETHFQKDGKSTRIDVFKGWQVRFYGATAEVAGKPMFLITGIDLSKKKNQADQDILQVAGKAAHELRHTANDRQKK